MKLLKLTLILLLLASITACGTKAKNEFMESCVESSANNKISQAFDFLNSIVPYQKDADHLQKYREYCSCAYNEIQNNLTFIERIKINNLEVGMSDPLYSKYMNVVGNASKTCGKILSDALGDLSKDPKDRNYRAPITSEPNSQGSNYRNNNEPPKINIPNIKGAEIKDNWFIVKKDANSTLYFDANHITKSSDRLQGWAVIDLANPFTISNQKYFSKIDFLEIDCANKKMATLLSTYNNGSLLNGETVYQQQAQYDNATAKEFNDESSIGGRVIMAACYFYDTLDIYKAN